MPSSMMLLLQMKNISDFQQTVVQTYIHADKPTMKFIHVYIDYSLIESLSFFFSYFCHPQIDQWHEVLSAFYCYKC